MIRTIIATNFIQMIAMEMEICIQDKLLILYLWNWIMYIKFPRPQWPILKFLHCILCCPCSFQIRADANDRKVRNLFQSLKYVLFLMYQKEYLEFFFFLWMKEWMESATNYLWLWNKIYFMVFLSLGYSGL